MSPGPPEDMATRTWPCHPAVIWRRTSGGTDSETGSRFVERVLSVVATCHQQGRSVLEYLTRCHRARLLGLETPSLVEMRGSVSSLAG